MVRYQGGATWARAAGLAGATERRRAALLRPLDRFFPLIATARDYTESALFFRVRNLSRTIVSSKSK